MDAITEGIWEIYSIYVYVYVNMNRRYHREVTANADNEYLKVGLVLFA